MNRWLETDTQKTARSIINVLNESAAGMVKKEINKDKPEEAPKEEKVALEKRVTKAAIKGKKPESKNAKMPEKTAKKVVKEELEPETEKSIEDQITDLQDYLNNTPEIAEDEKEAIQAEIDDLISQLGEKEVDNKATKRLDEKELLTETGEWDDDEDEMSEWLEDLRTQATALADNINGQVKSVSGRDKYIGPMAVIKTPKHGDIEMFFDSEDETGRTFVIPNISGGFLHGGINYLSDILNQDSIGADEIINESEKLEEASFSNKVSAIKRSLKKKDKRLSDKAAEQSAKNIAGAMAKKESLEQNEEDGWGEDVLEICEPFFEKVERTMYEVRNARRGSYAHFGDTVSDLAAWMGELSTEAEAVQSELDDMKEQLQESDKNKLKEEYSEKFGGDPKDFISDLISVKYQLSKLNLDSFGSHLARQMVEDFIETCDRQIEKAKRLASGDEFYTEANYLSPTRKEEPLDLVAYEPEITSIDEVKDKYVKIRGDFHKIVNVKPEGNKFVISFAAGTGTAIGGEFEPATLDEIKRLQLYAENK